MLSRIISSLRYRAKWAEFGVYYGRSFQLTRARIAGRKVALSFPPDERSEHEWEFDQLLLADCYHLGGVSHPVRTVLDIGANIGLFALAARHHFPNAAIHCYEPNPNLEPYLANHCRAISASYRSEAVGLTAGSITLTAGDLSLHSVAKQSETGQIPQVSFDSIVRNLGSVDLVKLDCEGAEWAIFDDQHAWQKVRSLVMEYHLWARPGLTEAFLEKTFQQIGFADIEIEPSPNGPWGFAYATRSATSWA